MEPLRYSVAQNAKAFLFSPIGNHDTQLTKDRTHQLYVN
ncbi:MAG: hypothetical protein JWO15_3687 [Sphingomonadales bacterium]|nr:hypothetical protein [Sphingomonadales bacterium]